MFQVGKYKQAAAIFAAYDPRAPEIAQVLIHTVEHDPRLVVEHIGSTAVPGCRGKGVIDLAVTYTEGNLEPAKAVLDALGFQKQSGREPFPETRPMRVAAVSALGGCYQVHAHVIDRNGSEYRSLISFRDALRRDTQLRSLRENQRANSRKGITDSLDY